MKNKLTAKKLFIGLGLSVLACQPSEKNTVNFQNSELNLVSESRPKPYLLSEKEVLSIETRFYNGSDSAFVFQFLANYRYLESEFGDTQTFYLKAGDSLTHTSIHTQVDFKENEGLVAEIKVLKVK